MTMTCSHFFFRLAASISLPQIYFGIGGNIISIYVATKLASRDKERTIQKKEHTIRVSLACRYVASHQHAKLE
jgi:hypothetical protein